VPRLGLGILILAAAGGGTAALVVNKPKPKSTPISERSLTVRTVTATEKAVARTWIGYGSARAIADADVAVQVAGAIVEKPDAVNAGRWVNKGDLLAQIDAAAVKDKLDAQNQAITALESQVESLDVEHAALTDSVKLAEQGVGLSEKELARAKEAMTQGAATENEIEALLRDLTRQWRELSDLRQRRDQAPIRRLEIEAQIRQQRASARLAQLDVDHSSVRAPISGVLQEVVVNVGDWVGVGQPIARIVDLSRIEAPMRLPMSAGVDVRVGDPMPLRADGPSDLRWKGVVVRIAPEADANTRTITVFAELEQDGRSVNATTLLPGQFLIGSARSKLAQRHIVAPRIAINGDRISVIGGDGRVQTRPVEVAFYFDASFPDLDSHITQWAAIEDGLTAGDRMIVSNLDEIAEGMEVRSQGATGDGVQPRASATP